MLEAGCFYKDLITETIVEIISIKDGIVKWRTLNKRCFDGHIFEDKIEKININYLQKLNNYEKD